MTVDTPERDSDTAQLSFVDVKVPVRNLFGTRDHGFAQLMWQVHAERLTLAVRAYPTAQRCPRLTLAWVWSRSTLGRPLIGHQLVRHRLEEMAQHLELARAYLRSVLISVAVGEEVVARVRMANNAAVEACDFVVDAASQLLGYLRESEVERHYRDFRFLGIGGGATEVLADVVARRMEYLA